MSPSLIGFCGIFDLTGEGFGRIIQTVRLGGAPSLRGEASTERSAEGATAPWGFRHPRPRWAAHGRMKATSVR